MKLALVIIALICPLAQAYLGPSNIDIAGQIYLNHVMISKVVCLPEGSQIKLNDNGQKEDFEVSYSECRKISSNPSYMQAAVCSQLDGDLVLAITDSAAGTFQNKHISEIRSLAIVQRACQ
jgi:hypothetical protein